MTTRYVCFYSNLFGFEKKIKVPWNRCQSITKENTAVFIPNAILVRTARREYVERTLPLLLRCCH